MTIMQGEVGWQRKQAQPGAQSLQGVDCVSRVSVVEIGQHASKGLKPGSLKGPPGVKGPV